MELEKTKEQVKKEMLILDKEQNEHNHGKLWMGYAITFFMLGTSIFLGTTIWLVDNMNSGLFILGVMAMLVIASALMFKGVIEKRNECEICKKN